MIGKNSQTSTTFHVSFTNYCWVSYIQVEGLVLKEIWFQMG